MNYLVEILINNHIIILFVVNSRTRTNNHVFVICSFRVCSEYIQKWSKLAMISPNCQIIQLYSTKFNQSKVKEMKGFIPICREIPKQIQNKNKILNLMA